MTAKDEVLGKYRNAYSRKHLYEDSVRTIPCWTIYRPQPGYEQDCVKLLSDGWDSTEEGAWAKARNKLAAEVEA